MIVGTAGHIDHGKTSLVRALTGVDTDRLPEEKRRGITIELGFAPLTIPGVGTMGVVDVPGHEAFVRTMLAGATGIDLALLVVAADEGVMPQTREHVAILTLLGVRSGVVALTKCDTVDADWIALVRDDIAALLAATPLASAPIVETSVVSGSGVDALRETLAMAAREIPARDADDLFRMPVDRAFSARGTGTVVTGTVWSGSVVRDDVLRIWTAAGFRTARVRTVQSHGANVDRALPGTRAAIGLAGVDVVDVPRGAVLLGGEAWESTVVLRAEVALLDGLETPLRPRERVHLHLGTSDVTARIVAAGGALTGGGRAAARVILESPVVTRTGDRFVLRRSSPVATIGGGIVEDPLPAHRRARPWIPAPATPSARLDRLVDEAGETGVEIARLPVRLGLRPSDSSRLLESRRDDLVVGQGAAFSNDAVRRVRESLRATTEEYHRGHPLEPGIPTAELRARAKGSPWLVEHALRVLVSEGVLELTAGVARQGGWHPNLTATQDVALHQLTERLLSAAGEPPSLSELAAEFGPDAPALVRILERRGIVIPVEAERYFSRSAVEHLVQRLRQSMADGRAYSPAELRDVLGLSRKFLIPFLEYCDKMGITERHSAGRVLHHS